MLPEKPEKSYIKYLDDNGIECDGWYVILTKNLNFIEFETNDNIITLPWNRILKVKQKKNNGDDDDE